MTGHGSRARAPYASIATILMSVLALIAGNALLNTLVPLRGKLEDFSSFSLGLLGSMFFAGMLAGTLLSPLFIRYIGHVKAYSVFAALAIIAYLMDRIGPQALFLFMAVVHAAVHAVTILRIRTRGPAEEKSSAEPSLPN